MQWLTKLWDDQWGAFVSSAELVLIAVVLAIGIVPGIAVVRQAVIAQFRTTMSATMGPEVTPVGGMPQGGQGN